MTVEEACKTSGIAAHEAELLAAYVLGKERSWILAHGTDTVSPEHEQALRASFERRRHAEPVAHILGMREFYGRNFAVSPATLIPRPSTEELVKLAMDVLSGSVQDAVRDADTEIVVVARTCRNIGPVQTIVDIGTGSGCIAITLALETGLQVIATDISEEALAVARRNAAALNVTIDFRCGDTLEPVRDLDVPFLVVSNPPYIPAGYALPEEVERHEPHTALFAGADGCDVLRKIAYECHAHPFCVGMILECREEQPRVCFPNEAEDSRMLS